MSLKYFVSHKSKIFKYFIYVLRSKLVDVFFRKWPTRRRECTRSQLSLGRCH